MLETALAGIAGTWKSWQPRRYLCYPAKHSSWICGRVWGKARVKQTERRSSNDILGWYYYLSPAGAVPRMQLLYLRSTAIADDNRVARDITWQVTPHSGNSDHVLFLLGLAKERSTEYIQSISQRIRMCLVSLEGRCCFCGPLNVAHHAHTSIVCRPNPMVCDRRHGSKNDLVHLNLRLTQY